MKCGKRNRKKRLHISTLAYLVTKQDSTNQQDWQDETINVTLCVLQSNKHGEATHKPCLTQNGP